MTDDAGVGDTALMKTRILSRPCDTCITRPATERLALSNRRVTEFIRSALAAGTYVVCHATLPTVAPPGVKPAVCRGFADNYDTPQLRTIRRLWGFVEVEPPDLGTHNG